MQPNDYERLARTCRKCARDPMRLPRRRSQTAFEPMWIAAGPVRAPDAMQHGSPDPVKPALP
jgi:hypothetical protein